MPPDERATMNIESLLKELQAGMLDMKLTLATIQSDMRHATSAAAEVVTRVADIESRLRVVERLAEKCDPNAVVSLDKRVQTVETKQYYMFILGGALGVVGSLLGSAFVTYFIRKG